jgi:hypothetical protein
MGADMVIRGAIIDSWVERARPSGGRTRLVLQVAPRGRPRDLMIVEAEAALVRDCGMLEDLGENLCHGNPIEAVGRLAPSGQLQATQLELDR